MIGGVWSFPVIYRGQFASYVNQNLSSLNEKGVFYKLLPYSQKNNNLRSILQFSLCSSSVEIQKNRYRISCMSVKNIDGIMLSNLFTTAAKYCLIDDNEQVVSTVIVRHRKLIPENLLQIVIGLVCNLYGHKQIDLDWRLLEKRSSIINRIHNKIFHKEWVTKVKTDSLCYEEIRNFADPFVFRVSQDEVTLIGECLETGVGQICIINMNTKTNKSERHRLDTFNHRSFPLPSKDNVVICEALQEEYILEISIDEYYNSKEQVILGGQFVDTVPLLNGYLTTFLIGGVLEIFCFIDKNRKINVLRAGCIFTRAASKKFEDGMWFQMNNISYGKNRIYLNDDGEYDLQNVVPGHHYDEVDNILVYDYQR